EVGAAPAPEPAPAPAPKHEAESPAPAALAVTDTIDLDPADRIWQGPPPQPRPRPAPRPFDRNAALKMIHELQDSRRLWHMLDLPAEVSSEEAHFWLVATSELPHGGKRSPRSVANELEKADLSTLPPPAEVRRRAAELGWYVPASSVFRMLAALLP